MKRVFLAGVVVTQLCGPVIADKLPDGSSQLPSPTQAAPAAPTTIDDSNTGWTWSGMSEFDDPGLKGGTGHAGMSGSYGVYTFTGTHVQVYAMGGPTVLLGGKRHRLGKLKVSIDSVEVGTFDLDRPEPTFDLMVCDAPGLKDGNHVLEVDPVSGWATIDYIKVIPDAPRPDAPQSPGGDPPNSGRVVFFDPMNGFDLISDKSQGWHIDNTNAAMMGGHPIRLCRASDDREYVGYRHQGITGFVVQVYSATTVNNLLTSVKFFASPDSGVTSFPVAYRVLDSFPGGPNCNWVGYDLAPTTSLPAHTNEVYITFGPGTGVNYDPELSQVSIFGKS